MSDWIAKVGFVLSVVVLAFLYGYVSRTLGLFPSRVLRDAWAQGSRVLLWTDPALSHRGFMHDVVYDRTGARTVEPGDGERGLTLVTSAWEVDGDPIPGLRLIDADGAVVHEWRVPPDEIFGVSPTSLRNLNNMDIQGTYLFPDGDVLVNVEYAGTVRLDACSEVRWKLEEGSHHSIARADDGTFWIPAVTSSPRRDTPGHRDGVPGLRRPVYQDRLLRVDEDGEVLEDLNVLDLLYENGLSWHLAEEGVLESDDPTHVNDVEPLPASLADQYPLFEAGDLVVSLRHLDLVLVVEPGSGRVKWSASGPWIYQHDPDWLGDGWIGVFDNRVDGTDRGDMLGGSRIVAVQPHTDSTRVLFPGPGSEPFYTEHRGKWQLLAGGSLLLVEEEAGRLVEVAPDGRTLWEWIHEPFGDRKVPSVSKGDRIDLSRREVAAWPCASGGPQ